MLRKLLFFVAGLLALGVAGGLLVWGAWWVRVPRGSVFPGLRVDGEALPPGADVRAFVEARAAALRGRHVCIRAAAPLAGGDGASVESHVLLETTLGDVGVGVDVDRVVALVKHLGAGQDVFARAELAARARRGEIDIPLLLTVSSRVLVARLEPLKEDEDTAPVPARLDLQNHTIVPERDGGYLDLDAAAGALEKLARTLGDETLVVPVVPFKSRMSREALAEIDIGNVIASYETGFSRGGEQASRARNVEVAASRIDGVVLLPGQAMSFNEVVGARSEENGFRKAHEILKGEMVEGVGGGTCQVASTLHAASFFGGLEILERFPHSRPSAYIPLGLDSTVVYPVVDLKLRNPFPFPVVIHSSITGSKVRVELLGHEKRVAVTYGQSVLATHPFARKVVEEAGVKKPSVKQKGIRGIELRRWRVLRFQNGEKRVETSTDTYPPTQEIYRVPPGFDPNELPVLEQEPDTGPKTADGRRG